MRIAGLVQDSIVDGPGLRFVIFTQGCMHNCPGCHNPDTHDLNGGSEMSVTEILTELDKNPLTDGITLSGGEPFLQAEGCAELAREAKTRGLNVWVFSGWTYEQLEDKAKVEPCVRELLDLTDVLIDGRFEPGGRSLELVWRGSKNQRVIDMAKTRELGRVAVRES